MVLKELDEFEQKPGVKEVLDNFEPFFKNKEDILQIIKLETYSQKSKDWEKINYRLLSSGIDEPQIKAIQDRFGLKADGHVGPATIKAIGEMYDTPISIKYADLTKYEEGIPEDFDRKYTEAQSEAIKKIAKPIGKIYEKAATLVDIKKAELKKIIQRDKEQKEADKKTKEKHDTKMENLEKWADQDAMKWFGKTGEKLGLDERGIKDYFISYNEGVEHKRFTPTQINEKIAALDALAQKCDPEITDQHKKILLVEAFGLLLAGRDPNVVINTLNEIVDERADKAKAEFVTKMIEIEENIEGDRDQVEKILERTNIMVKNNVSAANYLKVFWQSSETNKDEYINQNTRIIAEANSRITRQERTKKTLIGERSKSLDELYKTKLDLAAMGSGAISQNTIIEAESNYSEIGESIDELSWKDQDLTELESAYEDWKKGIIENPEVPELSRLVLAGKSKEAIDYIEKRQEEIRKETESEETEPYKKSARLSDTSILGIYKDKVAIVEAAGMSEINRGLQKFLSGGKFENEMLNEENGFTRIKLKKKGKLIIDGQEVDLLENNCNLLIKKDKEGNIKYRFTTKEGGEPSKEEWKGEFTISKERVGKIDQDQSELTEGLSIMMQGSPAIQSMIGAGKIMNQKFKPLQAMFQAGQKGWKSRGFVDMAKGYASAIKGDEELLSCGAHALNAIEQLTQLKKLCKQGSEFSTNLNETIKGLEGIAKAFEKNNIISFCNTILDTSYGDDNIGKWMLGEGLPWMAGLVVAVGAVIASPFTGGASLAVGATLLTKIGVIGGGYLASAAIGTAFGLAGREIAASGANLIGKTIYGDGKFDSRTNLQKYFDQEVYDDKGAIKIKGVDVAWEYGQNLVVGTLMTAATLGVGGLIGPRVAAFVSANRGNTGGLASFSRTLGKLPGIKAKVIDVAKNAEVKGFLNKVIRESTEEVFEEGAQEAANQLDSTAGLIISIATCSKSSKVNYELGAFNLSQDTVSATDTNIKTEWSFDRNQETEFLEAVEAKYGEKMGYEITKDDNGNIYAKKTQTLGKKGKRREYGTTMVFKPSSESISMKNLVSADGDPEFSDTYGVEKVGDRDFQYKDRGPEGKLDLKKYLKKQGFAVKADSEGTIIARKGAEVITFKPKTESTTVESKIKTVLEQADMTLQKEETKTPDEPSAPLDQETIKREETKGELKQEKAKETPDPQKITELEEKIIKEREQLIKARSEQIDGLEALENKLPKVLESQNAELNEVQESINKVEEALKKAESPNKEEDLKKKKQDLLNKKSRIENEINKSKSQLEANKKIISEIKETLESLELEKIEQELAETHSEYKEIMELEKDIETLSKEKGTKSEIKALKSKIEKIMEGPFMKKYEAYIKQRVKQIKGTPTQKIAEYNALYKLVSSKYPTMLKQAKGKIKKARLEISKEMEAQIKAGTLSPEEGIKIATKTGLLNGMVKKSMQKVKARPKSTKYERIRKRNLKKIQAALKSDPGTLNKMLQDWQEGKPALLKQQRDLIESIMDTEIEEMIMMKEIYGVHSKAELDLDGTLNYRKALLEGKGKLDDTAIQQLKSHTKQLIDRINSSGKIDTNNEILILNLTYDLIEEAEKSGLTTEQTTKLVEDSIEKLTYQTIESGKRQLGDHGIRHILGNVKVAENLMTQFEKTGRKFPPKQKLIMMMTQISHDMGYTSRLGTYGFDGTQLHPLTSEIMLDQQQELFENIVGKEGLAQMREYIINHDGTEFLTDTDQHIMGSIIRLSDNMALFSYEKLPEVFAKNPKALKILALIQVASETGVGKNVTKGLKIELKSLLETEVSESRISKAEAINLKKAVDEIFHLSGKFTLGMTGGKYGSELFTISQDGSVMNINLEESASKDLIESSFNQDFRPETEQFLKMINDYREGAGIESLSPEEFKAEIKKKGHIEFQVGSMKMKINIKSSEKTTKIDGKGAKEQLATIEKQLLEIQSEIKKTPTKTLLDKHEQLLISKGHLSEQIAMQETAEVKDSLSKIKSDIDKEMRPIMKLNRDQFRKLTYDERAKISSKIKKYITRSKIPRGDVRIKALEAMMFEGLDIRTIGGKFEGGSRMKTETWLKFKAARDLLIESEQKLQQKLQEEILIKAAS